MLGDAGGIRNTLKEHRRRRGLSQDELARLIGVRRQAVYDIESGRYLPNTSVALRLARVLGCTVETLFSEENPARPGFFHRPGRSETAVEKTVLILGCDPALSVLGGMFGRLAPGIGAHTVFASSKQALLSVSRGSAHVAGIHYHGFDASDGNIEAVRRLSPGLDCLMVAFSEQEEGIMVAPGNPLNIRSVADMAGGVRFVNREEGAALRKLLDEQLSRQGTPCSMIPGYADEVHSHSEGAVRVAGGASDAALGLRIVAESFGLDFVPLAVTRCDLVIPVDLLAHSGITALLDVLQSSDLKKELGALPGYDHSVTGKTILG